MERTKNKQADLILCADFHLREDTPSCRTDDFQQAQWKKLDFISSLQKKHKCPVFHAGDLFNHWKPSPYLLSKTIEHMPNEFFTIYGNHDLPQHNLDLVSKCGIHVLEKAGKLYILDLGVHWEETPGRKRDLIIQNRNILIWHYLTYQGKKLWHDCLAPLATAVLRKYPKYDLILTGHNHKTFVAEHKGRILVNPGSLTRQTSDQNEHIPTVFLYYINTNTVTPVVLPYNKDVVIAHINTVQIKERDERINAFISKLNTDWKSSISFEDNIKRFLEYNNISTNVKTIIEKAIDYE